MPRSAVRRAVVALSSAGLILATTALGAGTALAQTATGSGADCIEVPAESLVTPGKLTVVTNAASYPISYVDADGKIVGIRADYSQLIADALCLELEMINAPFDGHIPGLQSKRWDISASGMVYTPERVEVVKMIPLEVQGVVIWVNGGNPLGIETVEDLAGLRVGTEGPGYEFDATTKLSEEVAAQGMEPFNILTFGDSSKAAQALAAGQVDAKIGTVPPPNDGRFEIAGEPLSQTFKCLGLNDQALADAVVKAVDRLKTDGQLAPIFERYEVTLYDGETKVITADSPPN